MSEDILHHNNPSNQVGSTPEKETTIWAKLRGGTFSFVIKAKEAGGWLKCADSFVEEEGLTEQSAMELVVEALEDSEREEETLKLATMLLLWTACRCPAGKMAEEAARKGGKSVGFEIVHNSDGSLTYGLHVRDGFTPNFRSTWCTSRRAGMMRPGLSVGGQRSGIGFTLREIIGKRLDQRYQ